MPRGRKLEEKKWNAVGTVDISEILSLESICESWQIGKKREKAIIKIIIHRINGKTLSPAPKIITYNGGRSICNSSGETVQECLKEQGLTPQDIKFVERRVIRKEDNKVLGSETFKYIPSF